MTETALDPGRYEGVIDRLASEAVLGGYGGDRVTVALHGREEGVLV